MWTAGKTNKIFFKFFTLFYDNAVAQEVPIYIQSIVLATNVNYKRDHYKNSFRDQEDTYMIHCDDIKTEYHKYGRLK